jgi:hypothetical protein
LTRGSIVEREADLSLESRDVDTIAADAVMWGARATSTSRACCPHLNEVILLARDVRYDL